ncbi:MAG: hypothetical protein Q7T87_08355 [Polaromonas sp.]|nr:hypothetical protein [Polaromonas sp.]
MNDRTNTRFVPPEPKEPTEQELAKANETKEKAMQSPEFRDALRKDDEREARAVFNRDQGVWGQTGAGPDVKKTDPEHSQEREASRAQREEGYGDGES